MNLKLADSKIHSKLCLACLPIVCKALLGTPRKTAQRFNRLSLSAYYVSGILSGSACSVVIEVKFLPSVRLMA